MLAAVDEEGWQAQVIQQAEWMGWWVHHHYDSRRSTPGWPDLVLLRPPQILFVELKTESGRLTRAQWEVIDMLRACGLAAQVWRPSDWPEVERTLARPR